MERFSENHAKVRFDVLSNLPVRDRRKTLHETLHAAKVRMPDRKASWLAQNFKTIVRMGGVLKAKEALLAKAGRDNKMDFLMKSFEGVGPKYARNIMMDVYDDDFRESIAVDERIKKVSTRLG